MLVLSRKTNEKLFIPSINTSIEVVEVKAGRVRLGIEAPRHVQVVREELLGKIADLQQSTIQQNAIQQAAAEVLQPPAASGTPQRDSVNHALRNKLNVVTMGAELAREQLRAGQFEAAVATLDRIQRQVQTVDEPTAKAPAKPAAPKAKALLVEDDPNELELLAGLVRLAGFEVVTAQDGIDALDRLQEGAAPSVMLLDMMLPRCDGMSTVRNMRRNPQFDGVKIIAMSGYSAAHFGVAEQAAGIDAWFRKPIRAEALVAHLRGLTADVPLAV
jgi:carbon storage regulator CsrA